MTCRLPTGIGPLHPHLWAPCGLGAPTFQLPRFSSLGGPQPQLMPSSGNGVPSSLLLRPGPNLLQTLGVSPTCHLKFSHPGPCPGPGQGSSSVLLCPPCPAVRIWPSGTVVLSAEGSCLLWAPQPLWSPWPSVGIAPGSCIKSHPRPPSQPLEWVL